MDQRAEELIVEELAEIFGKEYALILLELEKERANDDVTKLIGGIRNLMVKAGGERFGEMIYGRLQARLGE